VDRGSEGERAVGRHGLYAEAPRETVQLEHLASVGRRRDIDPAGVRRRADADGVQQSSCPLFLRIPVIVSLAVLVA
jgi:hypothetical protein